MKRNLLILSAFATALAFLAAAFPAQAMHALDLAVCTSAGACASDHNKGTGPGIQGTSVSGNGVVGVTSSESQSTKSNGVVGTDVSTQGLGNAGVKGVSTAGTGVRGESRDGIAVDGRSIFSNGVMGTTLATNQGERYGVIGVDGAPRGSTNDGVRGQSTYSIGVQGEAFSRSGISVDGTSTQGATAFQGITTGMIFMGINQNSGQTVFRVDGKGDVFATSFKSQLQTSAGAPVVAYSNQSSTPSLEDFGEGSLVNGMAYIRFDERLASTMQRGARYLVFVTAQGPTQGALYVTQKTPAGFAVRENAPGRSSAAFDYRIVVQPLGTTGARLPLAPRTVDGVSLDR
jgi:hypothetical protein